MGILRMYLGGALLTAIGIIAIIIGLFVGLGGLVQKSEGVCATGIVILVIGIIVYFIGKFYVHVSKNTTPVIMMDDKKSQKREAYSPPPPPPPSFPSSSYTYRSGDTKEDIYEKMRTLKKMRDDGFISEEEYEEKRKELLSKI